MTLDDFIKEGLRPDTHWRAKRAHVEERGFSELYVRISQRFIHNQWFRPTLDIATVEVKDKGKGTFSKLVRRIRERHPLLPIYVESVIMERFQKKLERLGFENVGPDLAPSFFLHPSKKVLDGR